MRRSKGSPPAGASQDPASRNTGANTIKRYTRTSETRSWDVTETRLSLRFAQSVMTIVWGSSCDFRPQSAIIPGLLAILKLFERARASQDQARVLFQRMC